MSTERTTALEAGRLPFENPKASSKSKHDLLVAILFLAPAFAFLAVFVYLPTVLAFVLAFFNYHPGAPTASLAGFGNLKQAALDSVFQRSLVNTLYFAAMMVPATLLISTAIALLINRTAKLFSVARTLILMPYITPTIGTAIGWLWVYNPTFGLANAVLHIFGIPPSQWMSSPYTAMPAVAIYSLWHGIGFAVIILTTAINGLPSGVLEAAFVDGANGWVRFWKVTLPLISPTLFFLTVVTTIGSLQSFSQMYALSTGSGGPEYATTTTLFLIYQTAFQYGDFSYAAAMAIYLVLGIFVLTMFLRWLGKHTVFYQ